MRPLPPTPSISWIAGQSISIVIPGDPVPQARPRSRVVEHGAVCRACLRRSGKPFVQVYEEPGMRDWKRHAAAIMRRDTGGHVVFPSGTPLLVSILAMYELPKSLHRKTPIRRAWMPTGHDLDNVVKAILDAANGVLWDDDRQVVLQQNAKIRARQGRAGEIRLRARTLSAHEMDFLLGEED